MKNIVYLLSGLLLALTACKESKKIVGETVVGTPLSLQVPAGFYRDPQTTNVFVHNEHDASIIVNSYPLPYEKAARQFTKERFEGRDSRKLISSEVVEINGVEGLLYHTSLNIEGNNVKRWQLILPEGSSTISVVGTFIIDHEKELSEPIRNMMLSVYMDTDWKPDMSLLDFMVEPAGELKLAKMLQGPSVMYTADGKWVNPSINAGSLLCGTTESGFIDKQIQYTKEAFMQICPKCEIDGQDSLTVDGLKTQEVWGAEEDSTGIRLRYEAIVFDSLKCYYLVGLADKHNESRLKEFRSSVRTLKRKNKKDATI